MSIRPVSVTASSDLTEVIATDAPSDFHLGASVFFTEVRNCIWPTARGVVASAQELWSK